MHENWKTYKLRDICDLRKDSINPKNFNNEDYIGLEHIGQGTFLLEGLGNAKDVSSNKYKFNSGDILYGKIRPYFKKVYRPHFSGICSTDMLIFNSKNEAVVRQDYLYHLIKTQEFTDRATETSSGTKMPRADWKSLSQVKYEFPPLPEQQAIASILTTIDDKIENNLAMNKTLEDMAMALYKHWFIEFGPFKECKFVDSELGLIPEGWEVKQIKEIATVNSKSIKKGTAPERITYIDIASVNIGWVSEVESMHFSDAPSRARRIIDDGDIVWSTVRPNRKSRFLSLGFQKDTIVSTGFAVISPKIVPYSYLYPHCCTDDFTDYLVSRATGSSYPAVTGKIFEEALILYPPELILSNYDKLAKPYYQSFASNNIENQTLTQLRDTLLPKLISGEVRLKEFEEEITAAL